jgi:hypothetical protein
VIRAFETGAKLALKWQETALPLCDVDHAPFTTRPFTTTVMFHHTHLTTSAHQHPPTTNHQPSTLNSQLSSQQAFYQNKHPRTKSLFTLHLNEGCLFHCSEGIIGPRERQKEWEYELLTTEA